MVFDLACARDGEGEGASSDVLQSHKKHAVCQLGGREHGLGFLTSDAAEKVGRSAPKARRLNCFIAT